MTRKKKNKVVKNINNPIFAVIFTAFLKTVKVEDVKVLKVRVKVGY